MGPTAGGSGGGVLLLLLALAGCGEPESVTRAREAAEVRAVRVAAPVRRG